MLLSAFTAGMEDAGAAIEIVYASKIRVQPCNCGRMVCWNSTPGECCIKDSMQKLYPRLRKAEHLILATPVYIPLPGDMQNLINRLCPLVRPFLEFKDGRTRAQFRPDVKMKAMTLVATSGWWELGNLDTVVRVIKELAADASVPFGGAVLRPHVNMLKANDGKSGKAQEVLAAATEAGQALVRDGMIKQELLDIISQPLIAEQDWRNILNQNV